MIDSHTHLDSCDPDNAQLVGNARAAGVTRMLTVGTDEASNRTALQAAQAFDEVFAAVGRHPNHAQGFGEAELEDLRSLGQDPGCKAIGETGLDDFRDYCPRPAQEHAFRAQIDLARELGKPLVVHTRAAEQDTIRMLREHAEDLEVILHCFSMPGHLDECVAQGWWFSFAGNVTYPKNADLARAAAGVPAERLLVETDAPYLTPQAVRRQRNEPAFVAHTARFVAHARGMTYEALDALVTENTSRLLRW